MDQIARAGLQANDSPQAFAEAIIRILCNERAAAEASRFAYERLFSKVAAFTARDEALGIATAS